MSYLRDPRHQHSYELRPGAELDGRLRAIASQLEADELLEPGAATAPRFHPHLTFLRSGAAHEELLDSAAALLDASGGIELELGEPATFASGRIVHLSPAERAPLDAVRALLLDRIPEEDVDPIALERPWIPHVTIAYETRLGCHDAVIDVLRRIGPIHGAWASIECWDLAVRPTRLVRRVALPGIG